MPSRLFVSAAMAPQLYFFPPIHRLSTAKFLETLRVLGMLSGDGESRERVLRADCAAMESYTFCPEPPLDVPISAFMGDQDTLVAFEALRAWREQTSAAFSLQRCPGEHYFLTEERGSLLGFIREALG